MPSVWLVPCANFPDGLFGMTEAVREHVLHHPPADLLDVAFGPTISAADYYFVDCCVPRELLGKGVQEMRWKVVGRSPAPGGAPPAPEAAAKAEAAAAAEAAEDEAAAAAEAAEDKAAAAAEAEEDERSAAAEAAEDERSAAALAAAAAEDGKRNSKEAPPVPATPGAAAAADLFQVGDTVLTKATKKQEMYDKQKAKILSVLTGHYKLELLTGPAKGEIKKYMKSCVSSPPAADIGTLLKDGPSKASGAAGGAGPAMGGGEPASGGVKDDDDIGDAFT